MAAIPDHETTTKQEQVILALLVAPTVEKAAESCGMGARTVYRWLDDPQFMSQYRKARRHAFQQALGLVHKYAPMAVQTLAKVMTDPKAPHTSKVTAAATLLKFSRESLELDDLAQRIELLEQAQQGPAPLGTTSPPPLLPAGPTQMRDAA